VRIRAGNSRLYKRPKYERRREKRKTRTKYCFNPSTWCWYCYVLVQPFDTSIVHMVCHRGKSRCTRSLWHYNILDGLSLFFIYIVIAQRCYWSAPIHNYVVNRAGHAFPIASVGVCIGWDFSFVLHSMSVSVEKQRINRSCRNSRLYKA